MDREAMMRKATLVWAVLVWGVVWGLLRMVQPPIPGSVMTLYMTIAGVAILVWLMADEARFRTAQAPLVALLTEPRLAVPRLVVLAAVPIVVGWATFEKVRPTFDPPFEGRTIHPEPPSTFKFQGRDFDVLKTQNPLRAPEAAAQFDENLAQGRRVYFQNCMFCHGDHLSGDGHFAEAFNPLPANFRDSGTLSQLEESYVFWRVATGGPGLPKGATPWNSAMPAWQDFLTEEEIWQVILYIYEASGSEPRTWGEHGGGGH
jgi:mono/diheme cytochrome c family protein